MTEITLFFSTALLIFSLGIQQLNVQGNHYLLAAVTSLFIGSAQIFLWRTMPSASASEITAVLLGGPVGILAAMWSHPHMVRIISSKKDAQSNNGQ
jgi:ABC-type antimicrobial peptide transport system permease subunit